MSTPLLITSLPPRMKRLASTGEDIGAHYQERCINSWHKAAFEPVSINSAEEDYPHDVRKISTHRDAFAITGRPHVYFEDMLVLAAQEAKGRPFALTNADIILAPDTELSARVASLQPGEFLFSRRTDIESINSQSGTPFNDGYDFFAMHPNDTIGLSTQMIFGAPWWDHFLPLQMYFCGSHIQQIKPDKALHLIHEERWQPNIWVALGKYFQTEINRTDNTKYRLRFLNATKRKKGIRRLWQNLPWKAKRYQIQILLNMARMNTAFIDEISCLDNKTG